MTEQQIQQRIRLALSRGSVRLFRNNVGTGWAGRTQQITRANAFTIGQTLKPGDVVVRNARPFHAGLAVGSADLIGWKSIEITPDMVGQRVAVFASVEVKSPTGRRRPEQVTWQEQAQAAGALSGIARSEADARGILRLP